MASLAADRAEKPTRVQVPIRTEAQNVHRASGSRIPTGRGGRARQLTEVLASDSSQRLELAADVDVRAITRQREHLSVRCRVPGEDRARRLRTGGEVVSRHRPRIAHDAATWGDLGEVPAQIRYAVLVEDRTDDAVCLTRRVGRIHARRQAGSDLAEDSDQQRHDTKPSKLDQPMSPNAHPNNSTANQRS
jgi:hypothetical protein